MRWPFQSGHRALFTGALVLALTLLDYAGAEAQGYSTVYTFSGGSSDGSYPLGLTQDLVPTSPT